MKRYCLACCLLTAIAFFPVLAFAQSHQNTLEKIKQRQEVTIGYREGSIPLSFVVGDGPPQGYSIDISMQVADYLKTILKMPDLKITFHQITAQDRIDLIRNRVVDFECTSTTITPERARLVGFSRPFYVSALTFMFDQTKIPEISSAADLRDMSVALIRGTTGAAFLQKMNGERHLGINFVIADNNKEALRFLENGQAVAIFQDDVQLAGLRSSSPMAASFVIAGKSEHMEPYGCMYQLGDEEFGRIIDTVLVNYAKSDGLTENYKRWFAYPIDALGGINLKLPMSRGTREARDALRRD